MIGQMFRQVASAPEPDEYDISEDRIRELAIERAASRVRDVVDVIRRALPDVEMRVGEALTIVAGTALDHALIQVRNEHRRAGGAIASSHPLARMLFGDGPFAAPAVAYAETPAPTSPHRFNPSPIPSPDGDPRLRCASCAQTEDALIHHPDLVPDAADGTDSIP